MWDWVRAQSGWAGSECLGVLVVPRCWLVQAGGELRRDLPTERALDPKRGLDACLRRNRVAPADCHAQWAAMVPSVVGAECYRDGIGE